MIDCNNRQAERISLKMEKGRPKETTANRLELRDCLSIRNSLIYGNGASIVGLKPKGGRRHNLNSISQYNGFRYYSTDFKPISDDKLEIVPSPSSGEGELPRRFKKLIEMCNKGNKDMKFNDIYRLMFNQRMYEVAYHKLKSNPGNMTVGVDSTTLDGLSVE